MDQITFKDFKKLEIKIGTIEKAEPVEGSEKLIKLEVGLGEEKRQIIAGIAQFYSPENLVGKQVPVLTNLEPKVMMGLESQGMILAAEVDEKAVLLHPDQVVPPGSTIR